MKSVAAKVRHIQRLCCSGVAGQVLVPELLRELHGIVPSHSNIFLWCDNRYEVNNGYSEDPVFWEILPLYMREYHDLRTREVLPIFRDLMNQPPKVTHVRRVVSDDRRFYRSALYCDILRLFGWRDIIYTKIFSGRRPVGLLLQGQHSTKREIPASDARLMLHLAPFISHGATSTQRDPPTYSDSDSVGLLILGVDGELQYASPAARELLFLTMHPRIPTTAFKKMETRSQPAFLKTLCEDLAAVFDGDDEPARPPSYVHCNPWGRFVYRAQWLDGVDAPQRAVAITVQRQIPTELLLLRRLKSLGLPTKQADVCFHLASGTSYAAIAKKLGMSIHAVRWHTRELYARLDVHSAAQLGRKLLSDA